MLDAIWREANKFENVLQSLRVRRGKSWTQESTAELLDVKQRLYVGWENGENLPSPERLKKIVAVFGLNQEEEETLYRAAMRVPPKIRHLPFPPNPFFTGRKMYLEQLRQFLQADGTVALTQPVSISGLGGIGKTQLALAYAYLSYPKEYRVVLWVNAADRTTLQSSYDDLAQRLALPECNERDPRRRIQAVRQWLDDHTHWLLIMDNADDLPLARSFFPEVNHGHILLTTRSQFAGKIGARQIEIEKMEPEEGLVFLLRRTDKLKVNANLDSVAADIREPALQLAKLLDGHPLALDQAGAYIEETGVSFTDYINLYNKQRRILLDEREVPEGEHSEHPESVVATFELCFTKARERHPLATDILHFCTFLQPDAIPEELFQHDDSFMLDTLAFNKGIAALQRYSLIKRNTQEKILSLHRLVQDVLIDAMSHDLQKQWRERVIQAMNAAFPKVEISNWRQCERLLLHALVCATWTADVLTPTAEVADLLVSTGRYLLQTRAQYPEVEPLLARALSINAQYFGVEHPATLRCLNIRAALRLAYQSQQEEGAQAMPLGAWYIHALPRRLQRLGDIEQADARYQLELRIREQQLGATHPLIQSIRKDYADFLHSIGRDAEATALEANDEPPV